jgi:ubiquinone/menaquinone biosynthesis C-methylase UbiE
MLSELINNNILVKLLRGDVARYDLIAAMIGPKLGDRLLLIGCADGRLLAAVGKKTGLTGTNAAVEPDKETATRVLTQATNEGVLADVYAAPDATLPFDVDSFDIVVIPFPVDAGAGLAAPLREAFRVLRNGGRVSVIGRTGRGDDSSASGEAPLPIIAAIQQAGFRAARVLAERDKLVFYEGLKK